MPTREEYLTAANNSNINFLVKHQLELKKETFAQEIWETFATRHSGTFLYEIIDPFDSNRAPHIDIANIPDAHKVIMLAALTEQSSGVGVAMGLIERKPDFPFHAEVRQTLVEKYSNPENAIAYISNNKGRIDSALYEHGLKRELFYPHVPEAVRRIVDETTTQVSAWQYRTDCEAIVQTVNNMHNELPEKRYYPVSKLGPKELYNLIGQGRAEIFTSTFQEFSKRLFAGLKPPSDVGSEEGTLHGIINASPHSSTGVYPFLEACASYGAMDKVVAALTPKQLVGIAGTLSNQIYSEYRPNDALTYLDILEHTNAPEAKAALLAELEEGCRSGDAQARNLFSLVASQYAHHHKDAPVFCKALAVNRKFDVAINHSDALTPKELVDAKGRHFQGYLFYDDADGKESYKHLLQKYADKSKYSMIDKGDFQEITYLDGKVKMHLIVGKPEKEQNALTAMDAHLEKEQATFQSFVHRGHSYHAHDTLEALGKRDIPLLVLGSCGGYRILAEALEVSPHAHIVATQGTGTMLVNDPMLKQINNRIAESGRIQWRPLWEELRRTIADERFDEYVNPVENRATAFLQRAEALRIDMTAQTPIQPKPIKLSHSLKDFSLPDNLPMPPATPRTPSVKER